MTCVLNVFVCCYHGGVDPSVHVDEQRLILMGCQLEDHRTLSCYNIQKNTSRRSTSCCARAGAEALTLVTLVTSLHW